jgi:quercetin dioxygenase-like cupin family protein
MQDVHLAADAVAWEQLEPGIRRKILGYNDAMMMTLVEFRQGAVGALHSHPHTQMAYVQSGVFDVTIDGETRRLKAGDGYLIPSGQVHGVVALEDGVLVDVFTPMREDFVAG